MKNKPFSTKKENKIYTGQEYLASLDDGREIWYDGKKVKDVSTHPAFRNSARSVARFYDAMHNPELQDDLLLEDEHGIITHKFFAPSHSNKELDAARKAIAISQRVNYGWMGRTPDYKAAFMGHLGDNAAFYDKPYQANALNWYKKTAEKCLFLNHVLVDPPVDRSQERVNVRDVFVSVDKDDSKGIYVSGAKMVATGSMLTHGTFVGLTGNITSRMQEGRDEDMAVIFFADMNTPGLKMVCRPSYEAKATSAFDNPLSSRYDENDAVLVMDKAFIPWENVLVYRDIERCKTFYSGSGFFNRYNLQAGVRLAVKMEFMTALLEEGTKTSGTHQFRAIQAAIGEVVATRNIIWGMTTAMVNDTIPLGTDGVVPNPEMAASLRYHMATSWDKVRDIYQKYLAGAPIYTISSAKDLHNPEFRPIIDQYYRGTGKPAIERIKLFKMVWDAMYSEFAGRHALYERNYSGNHDMQRIDVLSMAEKAGSMNQYRGMLQNCLNDYDDFGWKNDWLNSNGVEKMIAS